MLKIIKRVLDLSGDLAIRIKAGFVCSFLDAVLAMLPLGALFYFLRILQQGQAVGRRVWLTVVGILLLGLAGRAIAKYLVYRFQSTAGFEFISAERIKMGEHLRSVPMGFYHKHSLGKITSTVTTDLNFLESYSMHILDRISTGVISMVVTSVLVLAFDRLIGIIFITGVLLSFLVYSQMQKRGFILSAEQREAQSDAVEATLDYIQGIAVVKSFNMNEKQISGIEKAYNKNEKAVYALEHAISPLVGIYSMVFRTASCLIMLAAAYGILRGNLDFASLAVILCAAFSIFSPLEVMGQMSLMIRMMEASLNRVEEIKSSKRIDENGREIPLEQFDITFENVSFAYEQDTPILKNVSFNIPQNTMTAIVGPSGGGKTTISRLIARFWDVQDGSIKIGGHDVREFSCDGLLQYISMVFQNVYLFHDTIENNIKFGVPNASHEQVIEAAKKACCHDFIMALPQGYQTLVGEGGATLSGGEKQRVSIARAILKDAPIILLDEATASVDPENEMEIQMAIDALIQNKTLIVIAHRLPTIKNADQILVVDSGGIAQKGTHQELLSQEGIYKRYWNIRENAKVWRIRNESVQNLAHRL